MNEKPKGGIIEVGGFHDDGHPIGWTFDCANGIPAIDICKDGTMRFAGWTVDELRVYAAELLGAN